MQILVDIPEKDIPKYQEVIDIRLHFIDGHIVDADGYGFVELPKDHGDLIDKGIFKKWIETQDGDTLMTEYYIDALDAQETIIEADTESEEKA